MSCKLPAHQVYVQYYLCYCIAGICHATSWPVKARKASAGSTAKRAIAAATSTLYHLRLTSSSHQIDPCPPSTTNT